MSPLITVHEVITFVLIMSRIMALILALPFFNTPNIPVNIKIFLLLSLSFFLMKITGTLIILDPFSISKFLFLILKELLIGFALGLIVNFFVAAFSYAGEIISYFMGLTIVNSFDPTYGQVSILSKFFLLLFYFLFFISDAYVQFFYALAQSLTVLPLDISHIDQGIWRYVIELSKNIFILAFQMAFPFILILYILNLALALVNRLIPQINVFIVGLPMQIFMGLAALAFGASVLVYMGIEYMGQMSKSYFYLFHHLG